jgi:hypothetical protein
MNNQEFSKRAIRHGDQIIKPIDELPKGLKEVYQGNEYIVGHSETGHHHVLTAPALRVYELDGELYLDVQKVGELTHQKTFDKHETKVVQPGFYKVQVKKAFDYFSRKLTQVRD